MPPTNREPRKSRTTYLPVSLIDRARNAVFWCRMVPGEPQSFAELTERGLRLEVERLEQTYNEGEPFEAGELRPGPAPGVMKRVHELRRQGPEGQGERSDDEAIQ